MRTAAFFVGLGVSIVAGISAPASAVEFGVARDGDDRGPGTVDEPFATLQRAQREVREAMKHGPREPVTVFIRGGTYRLAEPLLFGIDDGGTPQHAVVWKAAPGERVVVSGGRPIAGWVARPDGLWQAPAPRIEGRPWHFRELFVDGQRRTRSRHPSGGVLRVQKAGPDRRHSFVTNPNSFPPLTPGADVELVFLHDWSLSRIPVHSADPSVGGITLAHPVGAQAEQFAIDNFEPHPRFFLENDPAFLDTPGEWMLHESSGQVLYLPMRGESIDSVEIIAPLSNGLVVVRGDDASGTPVRNLHFVGIEFEHSAWPLPAGGYAGIQAGFYEVRTPTRASRSPVPATAAISWRIAESCSVMDATLRHVGGSGIEFGSRCNSCAIVRTVVRDVSVNGIVIGESDMRLVGGQPWWQAAPGQVATGNFVEDCLIERCGEQFYGGVGIWVGITAATTIHHNVVRDMTYTGISIGWKWDATPTPARENRMAHNHIHDVMKLLSDGGGIYTLGAQPGTVIARNLIHSIPAGVGRAESDGIFFDQGTTGFTVEGNTIYDTGNPPLRFHRAGKNLIRDNTLVVQPGMPAVRYALTPEDQLTPQANTIVPAERFAVPDPVAVKAGPAPEVLERLRDRW
ncbi:MAG: right-handed parallel beta-helix repeat-containing protein [Planctomycetaceae bacterium]